MIDHEKLSIYICWVHVYIGIKSLICKWIYIWTPFNCALKLIYSFLYKRIVLIIRISRYLIVIPVISHCQVVQTDLWWLLTHLTIMNHYSKGVLSYIWICYVVLKDHNLSSIFMKGNKCYERLPFWLWYMTIFLRHLILDRVKECPCHWVSQESLMSAWAFVWGIIQKYCLGSISFWVFQSIIRGGSWLTGPRFLIIPHIYIYIFIFFNYLW